MWFGPFHRRYTMTAAVEYHPTAQVNDSSHFGALKRLPFPSTFLFRRRCYPARYTRSSGKIGTLHSIQPGCIFKCFWHDLCYYGTIKAILESNITRTPLMGGNNYCQHHLSLFLFGVHEFAHLIWTFFQTNYQQRTQSTANFQQNTICRFSFFFSSKINLFKEIHRTKIV